MYQFLVVFILSNMKTWDSFMQLTQKVYCKMNTNLDNLKTISTNVEI